MQLVPELRQNSVQALLALGCSDESLAELSKLAEDQTAGAQAARQSGDAAPTSVMRAQASTGGRANGGMEAYRATRRWAGLPPAGLLCGTSTSHWREGPSEAAAIARAAIELYHETGEAAAGIAKMEAASQAAEREWGASAEQVAELQADLAAMQECGGRGDAELEGSRRTLRGMLEHKDESHVNDAAARHALFCCSRAASGCNSQPDENAEIGIRLTALVKDPFVFVATHT
jgi:hypothetical protein